MKRGKKIALEAVDACGRGRRPRHQRWQQAATTGCSPTRRASYIGIDISPEMLDLAHGPFPEPGLREGDPSTFAWTCPYPSFDLVLFSFDGLDTLDHASPPHSIVPYGADQLGPKSRVLLLRTSTSTRISYDKQAVAGHGRPARCQVPDATSGCARARHPRHIVPARCRTSFARGRHVEDGRTAEAGGRCARTGSGPSSFATMEATDQARGQGGPAGGDHGVHRRRRRRARPRHPAHRRGLRALRIPQI